MAALRQGGAQSTVDARGRNARGAFRGALVNSPARVRRTSGFASGQTGQRHGGKPNQRGGGEDAGRDPRPHQRARVEIDGTGNEFGKSTHDLPGGSEPHLRSPLPSGNAGANHYPPNFSQLPCKKRPYVLRPSGIRLCVGILGPIGSRACCGALGCGSLRA